MRRLAVLLAFVLLVPACPARRGGQGLTRPEPGTYTYEFSGRSLDPRDRSTVLNSVEDVEVTEKISRDGDADVTEIVNSANPDAVARVRTRWDRDGLVLVASESRTPQGSSTCEFEPPVLIVPDTLAESRLPRQTWESANCRGTVDVTVRGRDTVSDGTGRRWRTWKIQVRTRTTTAGESIDETETRWFSPELGKYIRTARVAEGIRAERRFYNQTNTLLSSRP